ncbi:MAG: TonB-dependent receptor [Balneolaceae bacterium]|nr:TonB-dependent receptor [Balneolaceae bacterium]
MKYKALLLNACMLFGVMSMAFAQSVTVEGTVSDANTGELLPGVNILIAGTSTGTVTDLSGEFTLNVDGSGVELVFTFVGYVSQTITITDQHISDGMEIRLEADIALMDEMVVVGFGTQRRADVTGAVSSISAADFERRPITNTAMGLQGLSPGLTIQYQGGQPGEEDVLTRVRGTGTLNNPNPLVLVDGIEQSLATVEASSIESITVLKDAASAAIYGSRAANGVILITTKRGAETGINVNYDAFVGVHNKLFFPEPADRESWMRLENEARVAGGQQPIFTEEYISNVLAGTNPLEFPFADFEGGIFQDNAMEYSQSISLSTGSETGRLYAAVNHQDTDGIIQNFNNQRASIRVNSDLFVTDDLTFTANLIYRNRDVTGPGFTGQRITQGLLHMNRDMIMTYPDGQNATGDLIGGTWNPHIMANSGESRRQSDDVVATGGLNFNISDVLTIEGDLTFNRTATEETIFRESRNNMIHPLTGNTVASSGWFSTNTLNEGRYNRRELSHRVFMNYSDSFENHSLGGTVGYEELYTRASQVSSARNNFFNNELRSLSAGDTGNQLTCSQFNDAGSHTSGCFNDSWRVRSFFGRANYTFGDRYSLQANVRYDGSSRFAEGNRWGFFPSFSAGWRISSESFMQDADFLSNLRVRASWGQLGNERMSSNERTGLHAFLNSYNLGLSYDFGDGPVPATGVTSAGNPNISWETTTMTNIGLDIGLLEDRLEIIAEYFWNYTSDILLVLPVPGSVGMGAPFQNAADVSNNGWELEINYRGIPSSDGGFQYAVGLHFSDVVNTIESLSGQGPFYPDKFTVWAEGYSINSLRGYRSPGIYRTQEDLDNYPTRRSPNAGIGDVIYRDLTGDGNLTAALYPEGDQEVVANEDPRYEFGLNFSASYRNFDFSMFWQGVMEQWHMLDGALVQGPNSQNFIPQEMADNRFHPTENPDGTWPRVMVGAQVWSNCANCMSDFMLEDTKYARLKNITVGYTVPQQLIQNLRLYFSGENLLTFTPTGLFDPELPRGRNQFYPHSKALRFGVNVSF